MYRSPTSPVDNNMKLLENIKRIQREYKPSHFLLFGDFNLPKINWETGTCPEGEETISSKFLDTINDTFLFQHVLGNTRFRGAQQSRLDLIFSNEEEMVGPIEKVSPPGKSDHMGLKWNFTVRGMVKNDSAPQERFQFGKGNYEEMKRELTDIDWDSTLGNDQGKTHTTLGKAYPKEKSKVKKQKPLVQRNTKKRAVKEKHSIPKIQKNKKCRRPRRLQPPEEHHMQLKPKTTQKIRKKTDG